MMILKQQDRKFELKVIDYEFLDSNFSEDLNWLNIEILAQDDFYRWKSKGAFLRTNEIVELFNWLNKIFDYESSTINRLDFLENELSFEFYEDKKCISVNLDFTFHPKQEKYIYGKDKEYKLFFDLEYLSIYKLNSELQDWMLKFPKR